MGISSVNIGVQARPWVVIVTSSKAPGTGGIQAWSLGLAEDAVAAGWRVTKWGLRSSDFRGAVRGARGVFRANQIVFCSWKYFFVLSPILVVRWLLGKAPRIQVLVHGLELADLRAGHVIVVNILAKALKVTFVANSSFTRSRARKQGLGGRWECQAPRVVLPDMAPRVEGFSNKQVVAVTRLFDRKNLFRAIDAVVMLNSRGAGLKFQIIGDGPLRGALQAYAEKTSEGKVELLGAVSEEEKWRWLQRADVFVLPSVDRQEGGDFEGYGLALIEANWAGVPVVAGPSGGMPEAVRPGQTGYVSDGSAAGIAGAIKMLLDEPLPVGPIRSWAMRHRAGVGAFGSEFFNRGGH